jgi:hypothetical protein
MSTALSRAAARADALINSLPRRPARPTVTFNAPVTSTNDDDWYEYDPKTLRVMAQLPPATYRTWAVPAKGSRGGVVVRGSRARHLGLMRTCVRELPL